VAIFRDQVADSDRIDQHVWAWPLSDMMRGYQGLWNWPAVA
jgi:hypothetical protein